MDETDDVDTDSEIKKPNGVPSSSSLDTVPSSSQDWDKSLPPTPMYNIPMSLASAHVGEAAARKLHSKFSSHRMGREGSA